MKILNTILSVVVAFSAATAFAHPPGHRPGPAPRPVPGPIVVRPAPRPPVYHRGPIVTRPGTVYAPGRPVYVHPGRPVYVAPRPWYIAPRVIVRPWVINPWVRVRYYPFYISPVYVPVVVNVTFQQGELWPTDEATLVEFVHYTFTINNDGLISLYPQHVCKDPAYCTSGNYNLATITIPYVRSFDQCGDVHYQAYGYTPAGDYVSMHLVDQARSTCATYETSELSATLNYASGVVEPLSGNSTYRASY